MGRRDNVDDGASCVLWLFFALMTLVTCVQHCSAAGGEWSYDNSREDGPSNWAHAYSACGGSSQSPINIELGKATHKSFEKDLTLANYDSQPDPNRYELTNNGHTVQLTVTPPEPFMTVTGGGLPGTYNLAQFHFHWGNRDDVGSEHTVDGKAYPLEIHFVHFDSKYASLGDALANKDGLAVLGVFAQVGDDSNANLQKLLDRFDNVQHKGTENTGVNVFALRPLLPSDLNAFVRYSGSLTTPGCNESVVWTVFTDPITITAAQMAKFRGLKSNAQGDGEKQLANNYRPVQQLNDRTVYLSSAHAVTSGHLQTSLCIILTAVLTSALASTPSY